MTEKEFELYFDESIKKDSKIFFKIDGFDVLTEFELFNLPKRSDVVIITKSDPILWEALYTELPQRL